MKYGRCKRRGGSVSLNLETSNLGTSTLWDAQRLIKEAKDRIFGVGKKTREKCLARAQRGVFFPSSLGFTVHASNFLLTYFVVVLFFTPIVEHNFMACRYCSTTRLFLWYEMNLRRPSTTFNTTSVAYLHHLSIFKPLPKRQLRQCGTYHYLIGALL
ncbi:hypothetical protein BX600DRAFT_183478 [Xylariales sp. PMI_506]|nr:hypothetical protein BX600DRAFT_183478 [Xylariales sp. PMI_506]